MYFIFKAILLVALFCTPLVDQSYLIDFIWVFIGCSLGSSFRYSPVLKLFLVNFLFLDFFDGLKYFETLFRLHTSWKYIYGWVILKTKSKRKRETKANRRQNRKEKNEGRKVKTHKARAKYY